MEYNIRTRGLKLMPQELGTIRRLIRHRLDHRKDLLRFVHLRLVDENGDKGGIDKLGKLELGLVQGGAIHLTGKGISPLSLAADLLDRANEALARLVGKQRSGRSYEKDQLMSTD